MKCQNYHENKHKFIYIKLNILNSNTSEVIKLQFIKLYISYFLLECNIPPNVDHLFTIHHHSKFLTTHHPLLNSPRVLLRFTIDNKS